MTKEFDFTSWQQQQKLLQTKIEEIRTKAEVVAHKQQRLIELQKSNKILEASIKKAQGLNARWQQLQQSLATNVLVKKTSEQGRYQQFENGIIYDTQEKLEWFIGSNQNIDWASAASQVEELNHQQLGNGWRLPDIEELRSLYNNEMKNFRPIFKNEYLWVWSGTLCKDTANKDEDKNYLELIDVNKDNFSIIGKNFDFNQIKESLPSARYFNFFNGRDRWYHRSGVYNGRVFGVRSGRRR